MEQSYPILSYILKKVLLLASMSTCQPAAVPLFYPQLILRLFFVLLPYLCWFASFPLAVGTLPPSTL